MHFTSEGVADRFHDELGAEGLLAVDSLRAFADDRAHVAVEIADRPLAAPHP